jgi:hypothetical protein
LHVYAEFRIMPSGPHDRRLGRSDRVLFALRGPGIIP